MQPGALRMLQLFYLAANMLSTLPASWGSREDVLPNLLELYISMHVSGPLPASWSDGFQELATLTIRLPGLSSLSSWSKPGGGRWGEMCDSQSQTAFAMAVPPVDANRVAASPSHLHLPPEWSTGFPVASSVFLDDLNISGTFPSSWSTGFPALTQLSLQSNQLSGPLPSQLLASHKYLASINVSAASSHPSFVFSTSFDKSVMPASLQLAENSFTGTLPPDWAVPTVRVRSI